MPKQSSSDAEAYDKEYNAFIKQLEEFHQQRGTSFKKLPRINGKAIDLYLLYVVVTARGGWQKVNSRNEWIDLLEDFWLHPSCVNSSTALKHIYIRYLDVYERIHFLGEDGSEQANDGDEDDSRAVRIKRSVRNLNNVPLNYNQQQHNVSDTARQNGGLSTDLYKASTYDRLALSLSCPLPNEHDFAFNMCTLLSNEGKHTLQLSQCPRLIELMLAHTGVFKEECTQKYFIANYKQSKGKSLIQFWVDSIGNKQVLELLGPVKLTTIQAHSTSTTCQESNTPVLSKSPQKNDQSSINIECTDSRNKDQRGNSPDVQLINNLASEHPKEGFPISFADLRLQSAEHEIFHFGRDLALLDSEGTRIAQVLHILRNLSFEENNVSILANSNTCLRFLVLCVCSRWGGLSVGALDVLGNVAADIILKDPKQDTSSFLFLMTICQGVLSSDRAFVLRSLEVINKLSINDANEEVLNSHVKQEVYDQICRYLTVHDIMLLIYTLECLFSLSSLGSHACNAIVRSKGAIQTLVSLLTVEAQSYGPEACIGMRVVETLTGVVSESDPAESQMEVAAANTPSTSTSATPGATPMAAASPNTNQKLAIRSSIQTTPKLPLKPMVDPKRLAARVAVPPDVEEFALDWVRRNYEWTNETDLGMEQALVYRHFTAAMSSSGKRHGLNPIFLSSIVRKAFGFGVVPTKRRLDDGTEKWHYAGLRRREAIATEKTVVTNNNTATPILAAKKLDNHPGSILKAHLSAPLRNPPSPIRASPQPGLVRSPSPVTGSFNSDSTYRAATVNSPQLQINDNSTLIKSMLASKVTTGPMPNERVVAAHTPQHHQRSTVTQSGPLPSMPFTKMAQSVLSGGHILSQSQRSLVPVAAPHSTNSNESKHQITRHIQMQNGPADARLSDSKITTNGTEVKKQDPDSLPTSFEGILQNGIKDETKPDRKNLLADLLEKTVGGEVLNGVAEKDILTNKQMYMNHQKTNGSPNLPNGPGVSVGIKRSASPDINPAKRIAIDAPGQDSKITLYVSQNGNEGEILSQGHQVMLNQGQVSQVVNNSATVSTGQVLNTQTMVTPQGQVIIQRALPQSNVILQQAGRTQINQRAIQQQGQVMSSPLTQVINSNGQVIQQVIAQNQNGQKVILHGSQLSQVLGGQVLLPSGNNQGLVVQGSTGQVLMQGVSANNHNPVYVQGTNGQGQQVLVHSSGGQGQQMLVQASQVSSSQQSPVVVSTASGQTMILTTNQGQSMVVSGNQQGQQLIVSAANQGHQMVVQGNTSNNTVFLTPQQTAAGQKTLYILPNQKLGMTATPPQNTQVVVPRQVVQTTSSSNPTTVIPSSVVKTTRPVTSTVSSPVTVQVNTAVAPLPKGPMATPVTPSVSNVAPSQSNPTSPLPGVPKKTTKSGLQYVCEWRGCHQIFSSPGMVYHHACRTHCPSHMAEITCQWQGCEPMVRRRFSAMTHIQDRHCNEQLLQIHALRRQQVQSTGKTDIPIPQTAPPHPGYAPNAAFHAIKRHALEVITQRDVVEKEGPVTKSIRLTAALVLRNLVIYSNMGKKLLHGHESELANVAISSMESSRTVGQMLYDINSIEPQSTV